MRTLTHSVSSVTVARPHKLVEDLDLEDMSPEQQLCSVLSPGENSQLNRAYPFLLWFPGSSSERIICGLFLVIFICLFACTGLVAAHRIFSLHCSMQDLSLQPVNFSCSMWDPVAWPGNDPGPPALGVWCLSHWTTREVLYLFLSSAHLFFSPWSWTLLFFFSYFPGHSSLFLLKFYPYFILRPLQTTWTHLYKR